MAPLSDDEFLSRADAAHVLTCKRVGTMSRRTTKALFWIPARLQGRKVMALADTGADRNCIRTAFLRKLPRPVSITPNADERLIGANSQPLASPGTVVIQRVHSACCTFSVSL